MVLTGHGEGSGVGDNGRGAGAGAGANGNGNGNAGMNVKDQKCVVQAFRARTLNLCAFFLFCRWVE